MRVDRAVVVLPVAPADAPLAEACLEHLVAAADEAAAGGVPTTVLLATPSPAALERLLASWAPLVALVDGVDLAVAHHPGAQDAGQLLDAAAAELAHRAAHAGTSGTGGAAGTLLLVTSPDVVVGPGWIAEHVRHRRAGARASTGPVRGGGDHRLVANCALGLDLLGPGGPPLSHVLPHAGVVHAVTPVVARTRVRAPASP
ncbi:hypothetical protein GTQ99_14610 [Kineococcus sp. T13]|uniref:hypothetical protein n=1 Tax=Kineococcus vitellinus TaxID=2696565 RepID=UPI0014131920|nr:hypothetical protein [Kineococcus vitellinus]NAZ76641.1 hypothetical protein [Kineococcus vitellinus]